MPITVDGSQILSVATVGNKVGYKVENATKIKMHVVLTKTATAAFDVALQESANGANFVTAKDDAGSPAKASFAGTEISVDTAIAVPAYMPYYAGVVTAAKSGGGEATIFMVAWHETLTPKITPLQWNQSQA